MNADSIRAARAGELMQVQRLASEVWRTHYHGIISADQIEYMLARMYSKDALTALIEGPGSGIALAHFDDALVGFAAWLAPPGFPETKLDKLYIATDHQRQGIGGALIDWVIARVREQGACTLVLNVNKLNVTAQAAYRKHGFRMRGGIVIDIGGGFVMDDYVMARPLDP